MAKFSKSSFVISFDEISSREHIMRAANFSWHSISFTLEKQHIFANNHSLSSLKFSYFMNLRSSYSSLRCKDLYMVEIYSPHTFSSQFGSWQDLPASGTIPGSKVDAEITVMDKSTSSRKRCTLQEVQNETSTNDHPSGHLSPQRQLDEMSDETLLIQRSRRLRKKFSSDERSTSTGDRDSDKF
ncbi:hypothetical protein ACH5RR_033974 [Cinchona calisaya]|uniref:Uncharacterized protein n=1 Tax=Cinchona calisaya TaxID=153742 RepID=A0ABD2Y9I5_9GENT